MKVVLEQLSPIPQKNILLQDLSISSIRFAPKWVLETDIYPPRSFCSRSFLINLLVTANSQKSWLLHRKNLKLLYNVQKFVV